jgi:hypothetical protein
MHALRRGTRVGNALMRLAVPIGELDRPAEEA